MAKYCVTGGCGFIGSHLVDTLITKGHQVIVLDNLSTGKIENLNPKAYLKIGDICNPQDVFEVLNGVDGCFHLAATASNDKMSESCAYTNQRNLIGTINIFEAAAIADKGKPIPVMFASSASVYGENSSIPFSEKEKLKPVTKDGVDKLNSELHGRIANLIHNVPNYGFRFFNVYGPRQASQAAHSGVIKNFADKISKGENLTIFGDGLQTRDFIYVTDAVEFLMRGMKHCKAGHDIFNVCTGYQTTIKELAYMMMNLTDCHCDIDYDAPKDGDIRFSVGLPNKIEQVLSYKAQIGIEKGLELVFPNMLQNTLFFNADEHLQDISVH